MAEPMTYVDQTSDVTCSAQCSRSASPPTEAMPVCQDRRVASDALSVVSGPLLGRDAEVGLLTALLARIAEAGSSLVLLGEPGIGKSRLLAEAERLARERDIAVLRTVGVQSEAHLAFAGLHQLLRPARARIAG